MAKRNSRKKTTMFDLASLLTERDGRALAIAMLREAEKLSWDETCLYPHDEEIRNGRPQTNFALHYLKKLQRANNEKLNAGFASVLSCFAGGVHNGGFVQTIEAYEEEEKKGAARSDSSFQRFIGTLVS